MKLIITIIKKNFTVAICASNGYQKTGICAIGAVFQTVIGSLKSKLEVLD